MLPRVLSPKGGDMMRYNEAPRSDSWSGSQTLNQKRPVTQANRQRDDKVIFMRSGIPKGMGDSWKVPFRFRACIGAVNAPLTPPRRGTDRRRTNACSPLGRGRGRVASWAGVAMIHNAERNNVISSISPARSARLFGHNQFHISNATRASSHRWPAGSDPRCHRRTLQLQQEPCPPSRRHWTAE